MEASTKSRFKPLPKEEVAICRRVAEARTKAGMNQAALGAKIGMTRGQVMNLETARVALKWHVGLAICSLLNLNQLWLATGQEPMHPFFQHVDPGFVLAGSLFSAVCKDVRHQLDLRRDIVLTAGSTNSVASTIQKKAFRESLSIIVNDMAEQVEPCHMAEILDWLPIAWRKKTVEFMTRSRKK